MSNAAAVVIPPLVLSLSTWPLICLVWPRIVTGHFAGCHLGAIMGLYASKVSGSPEVPRSLR